MKTSVFKKCFLVLLVISSWANCIESINLKLGANCNFFLTSISNNPFQKVDFPSPIEISIRQRLLKKLSLEYGVGYYSRTEYSQIDATSIGSDGYTINNNKYASFELRSNYVNAFVLPELDFNVAFLNLYFNAGPHFEYYVNTYYNKFEVSKGIENDPDAERMLLSVSQGVGGTICVKRIILGLECTFLENITKVYSNSSNTFLNVMFKANVGYQF